MVKGSLSDAAHAGTVLAYLYSNCLHLTWSSSINSSLLDFPPSASFLISFKILTVGLRLTLIRLIQYDCPFSTIVKIIGLYISLTVVNLHFLLLDMSEINFNFILVHWKK